MSDKGNLVLARGLGEALYIGRDIVVTVVEVGRMVKLAIEAPRDVAVSRDDHGIEQHIEHQKAREAGITISKQEAQRRVVANRGTA